MEYESEGGRDGMLYVAGYCPGGMVVPTGQGSGSSDTSDARCDSSRSEAGESPCSSVSSEDGLLRLPLILPQGFAPMHCPVRVTHRNGMKLFKPNDGGVYYVRPQGEPTAPQFLHQPAGMKFVKPGPTMCSDGSVYYMKAPSEDTGMHALPPSTGMELVKPVESIPGDGQVYYMKPQIPVSGPNTFPQLNGMKFFKTGDPLCVDGNVYYVKSQNDVHEPQAIPQFKGMKFLKPSDGMCGEGALFEVKPPGDGLLAVPQPSAMKVVKSADTVYGGGNMYYMKPQNLGPMPMSQPLFQTNGMKVMKAEENGMFYMKPSNESLIHLPEQPVMPTPAPHPVPVGWRRLLVDNSIIYLSPSNVALSNVDQVKVYLQSAGTCKCGLQCPVRVEIDFNFNPKVPSRPWDGSDAEMTKLCNHKRKLPQIPSDVSPLKRKKRKASPYAGVSVSQLLAQRERDRALAAQVHVQETVAQVERPRALPPWQQRVPPLQQHQPPPLPAPLVFAPPPTLDRRLKPKPKSHDQPTFMDDPNGYLAQQTALLQNTFTDAGRDSPVTSTVVSDPRPIQGGTVSTSEGSPPMVAPPAQSPSSLLVSSSLEPSPTPMKPARRSPLHPVQSVVTSMATGTTTGQHIFVSGAGHYLGGLKLSQPPAMGTVLVNAMPAPFVLQPGVMAVDAGLGLVTGNVLVDNPPPLLSPDRKKKGKKRRTAIGSSLVQMPSPVVNQGFAGVLVPGKPVVVNNPINVLQPVVQNLPLQQLLVPGIGNLGNMVMAADGSTALLHDHGLNQLQLQPLLTNTSVITTPAGMLIRSPNALMGQVSPQEYIQLLPQSSAAVVQQNTTIVQQQTTMMTNMEKPLELEIVASQSQQQSVSTQTCGSKETSQAFCQTVSSPPPVADTTTTDDPSHVTSSIEEKFSPNAGDESVVSSHLDATPDDSQTVLSAVPSYLDAAGDEPKIELKEGDLVWGAARGCAAWPGQIIGPVSIGGFATIRWFGGGFSSSKVNVTELQTLSEGLDAHHQANNASRRTRKLRAELEAAIQEAMLELDKIAARKSDVPLARGRRSLR